jgi:cytochrome c553
MSDKSIDKRLLAALLALALFAPLVTLADGDKRHRGRGQEAREQEHEEEEDEGEHEGGRKGPGRAQAAAVRQTPAWKAYAAECGSCHLAFPPELLPARSWKVLAAGLGDHFGQNAELDAKARAPIEAFLVANAGRDPGGAVPLRITSLDWWKREHREVAPSVFARKAVASAANCLACHPGANDGAFGEHQVKIPRDAPPAR